MSTSTSLPPRPPTMPGWNGEQLHEAFANASKTKRWTLAYRSFDDEQASCSATVHGRIPDGLRGRDRKSVV